MPSLQPLKKQSITSSQRIAFKGAYVLLCSIRIKMAFIFSFQANQYNTIKYQGLYQHIAAPIFNCSQLSTLVVFDCSYS